MGKVMYVIAVFSDSGVSLYGDHYGIPYDDIETAQEAAPYYQGLHGAKDVQVLPIHDHHNRQNDGA